VQALARHDYRATGWTTRVSRVHPVARSRSDVRPAWPSGFSRTAQLLLLSYLSFTAIPFAKAQDVLTYHNDNARTGQNLNETISPKLQAKSLGGSIVFIGLAVPLAPVEDTAPGQFRLLTSSSAFLRGLADSVDLSPVFLDGAYADSRDGEEFCGVCGTPLSNGSQRLIVEDAERRQTPPPRFEQSPGTQRLFDA